jgi:outer membrane protein assembly factor BamB
MRSIILIAVLAATVLPTPRILDGATVSNWPQFRGLNGAGVSQGQHLPTTWSTDQNVAWAVTVPGCGWSSPIVWREKVFVTSASG